MAFITALFLASSQLDAATGSSVQPDPRAPYDDAAVILVR